MVEDHGLDSERERWILQRTQELKKREMELKAMEDQVSKQSRRSPMPSHRSSRSTYPSVRPSRRRMGPESARRLLDEVSHGGGHEYTRPAGDYRTHLLGGDVIDLTKLGEVDDIQIPKAHLPGIFPRASSDLLSEQQLAIYVRALKQQRIEKQHDPDCSLYPRRPSTVTAYHSGPGYRSSVPGELSRPAKPKMERSLLPSDYGTQRAQSSARQLPPQPHGYEGNLPRLARQPLRPPKSGGRRVHPHLVLGDVASRTESNPHLKTALSGIDTFHASTWKPQEMYHYWSPPGL